MKTYSNDQPDVYAVSGTELRVHWDLQQVSTPGMEDSPRLQWEASEALCSVFDARGELISKIIRSEYSIDGELAAINNQATKPDEYAKYQEFRAQAKTLADGWLSRGA